MGAHCCHHDHDHAPEGGASGAYRSVLWAALAVNAVMFVVELAAGIGAGSVALQADALDFLGDAANYGVSLFVLGMAVAVRARAAQLKAASMGLFGLWVIGSTAWNALAGTLPKAEVMGAVGLLAFSANLGVALMLYRWRAGDSNMRSVWLCTRNDAIGNVAVVLAAVGVFGTGTAWPDLIVALVMASLALMASAQVFVQARKELTPAIRQAAE